MSLATEIAEHLGKHSGATSGELLEACPSADSSKNVASVIVQMVERGQIEHAGTPGAYTYSLVDGYVPRRIGRPAKNAGAPPPKPARAPKAEKKTAQKSRSAAKPPAKAARAPRDPAPASQRQSRAVVPAAPQLDDNYQVGLQVDGSILVYDRAANNLDTIPATVVRQIMALAAATHGSRVSP